MRHQENIKNAQHSKVGRVNLGARFAPKVSRKCQDGLLLADVAYRPEGFCSQVCVSGQPSGRSTYGGLLGCPGFVEKKCICPDK